MASTKVIERLNAHYEVRDVAMGKVYRWHPESIVVEREECGENQTLSAPEHACNECGTDHQPIVEEVLEAHADEEDEERFDHPGVHYALTTHPPGSHISKSRRRIS